MSTLILAEYTHNAALPGRLKRSIKWLVCNIIHLFELFAAASENVFLRGQVDYNAATHTSRSRVTICLIAGRHFGTGTGYIQE